MLQVLTPEKIAEIAARYETPDDPPCTCQQVAVDLADISGCDLCSPCSDFNRAHQHAKYMLSLHGLQDIDALVRSHEELRKASGGQKPGTDASQLAEVIAEARHGAVECFDDPAIQRAFVISMAWGEAYRRGLEFSFAEIERAVEEQGA